MQLPETRAESYETLGTLMDALDAMRTTSDAFEAVLQGTERATAEVKRAAREAAVATERADEAVKAAGLLTQELPSQFNALRLDLQAFSQRLDAAEHAAQRDRTAAAAQAQTLYHGVQQLAQLHQAFARQWADEAHASAERHAALMGRLNVALALLGLLAVAVVVLRFV